MSSAHPPVDPDLVALLRCPETGQTLALAPRDVLESLNAARPEPFEAALLREDGAACYPVVDGSPVLLPGEAIPLSKAPRK